MFDRPRQDVVEAEMSSLQADINAAHARLLVLVREHSRNEWWGSHVGVRTPQEYLTWRLGLPPARARMLVRVAAALECLPKIERAFADGRLSLEQVQSLTDVATPETEEQVLELALGLSGSQLARFCAYYRSALKAEGRRRHRSRYLRTRYTDDGMWRINGELPAEDGAIVERALHVARDAIRRERAGHESVAEDEAIDLPSAEDAEDPYAAERADALVHVADRFVSGSGGAVDADRHVVVVHADITALANGEGVASLEDGGAIPAKAAARIACDAPTVSLVENDGRPLSVGRKTRRVNRTLRRALDARDRGCRFPGCHRRGRTEAHHIQHWSRGGATEADNLLLLCSSHHTAVHERDLTIERSPTGFTFRTPDGAIVQRPPLRALGPGLRHANASRGVVVTPETCEPAWLGERGSIRYVVDLFLSKAPP